MTKFMMEADYWAHSTRRFYEEHAAEYAATTLKLSMRTAMDEFGGSLSCRASVLDLGCGGGRDLRALREGHFCAIGLDWAISIAAVARHYSGCPTVVGDLRDLPFADEAFDGAWASASLLHLRRNEVPRALAEAWRVLKPGASFFASVKKGAGEIEDSEGRWFTFFERDEWRELLATNGFIDERIEVANGFPTGNIQPTNGSWITSFARRSLMSVHRRKGHAKTMR